MTFAELIEALQTHFSEYFVFWIVAAVILLPIIFFTRKYSLPFIFFTTETVIYIGLMHTIIAGIVRMARWFAINSSMKALRADGTSADDPEWHTPFIDFWTRGDYHPFWVFWIELVFAIIIIILVFRFRPMKRQKKRNWKYDEKKKKAAYPGARGGSSYLDDDLPPAGAKKGRSKGRGRR